jgi:hypothetical protein
MMKKYRIIWYKDLDLHTVIITARNRREALQKAWSMFGEDVIHLEELKDE